MDEEEIPPIVITEEMVEAIYDRADQVAKIKFGASPDKIILDGGSSIKCRYETYCCGSTDYEDEYINVSDLTKELDAIRKEAEAKKAKEKIEMERKRAAEQKQREEREKEQRLRTYQALQKEFGK